MRLGFSLLALAACTGGGDPTDPQIGPLGIPLGVDGVPRAGAGVVDLTPAPRETFSDLNGNATFEGCIDQPEGGTEACPEPFDDLDGDGVFEPTWIGGFSPLRPALGVHEDDGISVRAVLLAQDGEYVAMVGLDLVGLGAPAIHAARDILAEEGFDPTRLIVASTHDHQGPDTMGLWGDPLGGTSGIVPEYQDRLAGAIVEAVHAAAEALEPVTWKVGAVNTHTLSPWFNGRRWGGKNPDAIAYGMIHDQRDPVIAADQLLVMQGVRDDGTVSFTFTQWPGHPEVRGGNNNLISADWVGVTRQVLEAHYGGIAVHVPECLGGMQSALGADLPLVEPDGTHVYQACDAEDVADPDDADCYGLAEGADRVDGDGDRVPAWAPRDSWAFVTSHGWHIAEAAIDVLETADSYEISPIRVEVEPLYLPIHNVAYNLLGPRGLFEVGLEDAVTDRDLCPEAGELSIGCIETHTFRAEIGPIGFVTVPGELLPELAWGLPEDDPAWQDEVDDPTARGGEARYFPQHDHDCDTLSYEDCLGVERIGDCDCLAVHAWPYRLSDDPTVRPLLDVFDTEFRAAISMTDAYFSYVIPEPDVNHQVSLFSDTDGDHYEDTVTPSWRFATRIQEAQARISERW